MFLERDPCRLQRLLCGGVSKRGRGREGVISIRLRCGRIEPASGVSASCASRAERGSLTSNLATCPFCINNSNDLLVLTSSLPSPSSPFSSPSSISHISTSRPYNSPHSSSSISLSLWVGTNVAFSARLIRSTLRKSVTPVAW